MGSSHYSFESRSLRAEERRYSTATMDELFTQQRERKMHESMNPRNVKFRESRDSENHPLSIPVLFGLDATGSMLDIPVNLIRTGLPHLMEKIIAKGIKDPQILFLMLGDHVYDRFPLQVGQFESGDEELDLWLTRSYLEGGGGSNPGESYGLAWYFAAFHTETDHWVRRGEKGLLITVGDEEDLGYYPNSAISGIMGDTAVLSQSGGYSKSELLALAQEKYYVYHLHMMEGNAGRRGAPNFKKLLGQNFIEVADSKQVPDIVADIVINNINQTQTQEQPVEETEVAPVTTVDTTPEPGIML